MKSIFKLIAIVLLLASSIQADSRKQKVLFEQGVAYLNQMKDEEAAQSFNDVIAMDPKSEYAKRAKENLKICNDRLKTHSATTNAPAEINAFSERVKLCLHWAGEVGSGNAAREADIGNAVKKLGCKNLKADSEKLLDQFKSNPAAMRTLDDANKIWQSGMGEPLFQ